MPTRARASDEPTDAPEDAPVDAPVEDAPVVVDPAAPTPEELKALMAQVQAMQAELNAARGMPTDPVGAAAANLKAHVTARAASGLAAYAELVAAVNKMEDTVDSKVSDLVRTIASEIRDHVEGADYIKALANDLHKAVLTG